VTLLATFFDCELRFWEQVLIGRVVLEFETQVAMEVLDGRDVAKSFCETHFQEVLEALPLNCQKVGELQDFIQIGEGITLA
jgi:hypothetical protein